MLFRKTLVYCWHMSTARTSNIGDQLTVDEHEGVVIATGGEGLTRASVREARL